MIEDMTVRNFGQTRNTTISGTSRSSPHFLGRSPDTATAEDLRRFQVHRRETGAQAAEDERHGHGAALLLQVTLGRPETRAIWCSCTSRASCRACCRRRMSLRLLEAAPGPKYKAALSIAYGAGLRAGGRDAEGRRHRQPAHADPRRARARAARTGTPCCSPQLLRAAARLVRIALPPRAGCFPGRTRSLPMTARQLNRVCHMAAELPGWPLGVAAHAAALVRNASAGAEHRCARDPGAAGPCEVGHDRALHAGRHQHPARGDEPARPADAAASPRRTTPA